MAADRCFNEWIMQLSHTRVFLVGVLFPACLRAPEGKSTTNSWNDWNKSWQSIRTIQNDGDLGSRNLEFPTPIIGTTSIAITNSFSGFCEKEVHTMKTIWQPKHSLVDDQLISEGRWTLRKPPFRLRFLGSYDRPRTVPSDIENGKLHKLRILLQ